MRKPYRGAGLALIARAADGRDHVLLFQRVLRPAPGTWTFPGGGAKREEPLAATARRETLEELSLWSGADPLPPAENLRPAWRSWIPFFTWTTFAVRVQNPDLKLPTKGRDGFEWSRAAWFPVDKLPSPLHCFTKGAVRRAVHVLNSVKAR